jgi:hypothetical protein
MPSPPDNPSAGARMPLFDQLNHNLKTPPALGVQHIAASVQGAKMLAK